MATLVVDIYDCGILVCDGNQILANSSSHALIESENTILVGESAEQQAHLRPREVSTQFWEQLSATSNTKHVVSNAEIAYTHLQYVWKQVERPSSKIILTIPNTLSKQELGLLLGICENLSIRVLGIVSKAVLALQGQLPKCKAVYLDILQQHIVITEVSQQGKTVSSSRSNIIIQSGMQSLINNIAKFIAEKFIVETRFDPMHVAEDEQQFFDKLPVWLQLLEVNDSIECRLRSNTGEYRIELQEKHMSPTNLATFNEISKNLMAFSNDYRNVLLLCSPTCHQVFGLYKYLQALPGCAVMPLNAISLAKQALLYKVQIDASDDQIHYTTTLKWNQDEKPLIVEFNPGSLQGLNQIPTHVLINHRAHPLSQVMYVSDKRKQNEISITNERDEDSICKIIKNGLLVKVEPLNDQIVKLNETKLITKRTVQIGDCLHLVKNNSDLVFIKI